MPLIVDQATVDSIVESVYKGAPVDVDVEKIADEDEVFGADGGPWFVEPFPVCDLDFVKMWYLDDEETILDHFSFDNSVDLTDELRFKYALEIIEKLFLEDYEGDFPLVCAIELFDSNNRKALIAFQIEGMSLGTTVTTTGVFLDEDSIRGHYRQEGYITNKDTAELREEDLQALLSPYI